MGCIDLAGAFDATAALPPFWRCLFGSDALLPAFDFASSFRRCTALVGLAVWLVAEVEGTTGRSEEVALWAGDTPAEGTWCNQTADMEAKQTYITHECNTTTAKNPWEPLPRRNLRKGQLSNNEWKYPGLLIVRFFFHGYTTP